MSLGPRVLFLMVKYLLRFRIKRLMSVSIQGGEAVFLFCSLSWDKHVDSGLDVVFECLPCCLYITSPRNILVMVEVLNVVPKAIPISSLVQPDISWLLVVVYCHLRRVLCRLFTFSLN